MDFHLIQALHETRELAARHPGEPRWEALLERSQALLARLTTSVDDPARPEMGADRIRRDRIAPEEAERAVAALMAAHDRDGDEQLELARDALDDLQDAIG